MADDGMLLNFEVGDGPLLPTAKVKGGHWKDRMRARNVEKRRTHSRFTKAYGDGTSPEKPEERILNGEVVQRPVKRQRVGDGAHGDAPPVKSAPSGGHVPFQRPEKDAKGGAKPFVSSLFTYNPSKPPARPEDTTVEVAPVNVLPSNAPLDDEAYNFTSLGVSPTVANHLTKKMDLKTPTAVQKFAIPKLLEGDADAFIQAETGSGKTLSYLLPVVQKLTEVQEKARVGDSASGKIHRDSGLFAIILAPTRELCKQIATVLETLLRCAIYIVPGSVTGGENKQKEKARLRKGLNILVATPGRLIDHLQNTKSMDLSLVRWLVLDEGDRLMELGFEDDIKQLLDRLDENLKHGQSKAARFENLPQKRATILCSATMRMDVQRLGDMTLRDAVHVQADSSNADGSGDKPAGPDGANADGQFRANRQLHQSYLVTPPKLRLVSLVGLIRRGLAQRPPAKKIIVFVSCADSVDFHFTTLSLPSLPGVSQSEIPPHAIPSSDTTSLPAPLLAPPTSTSQSASETPTVFRLHSSLPQPLRHSTLKAFQRTATPAILLTTDLSSRGLDLPIDFVIELDAAASLPEHLHRVGRTARAGRDGKATVLLAPGLEEGYADALKSCVHKDPETGVGVPVKREDAEALLARVFSVPSAATPSTDGKTKTGRGGSKDDWRTRATDLQLHVERWIAADPKAREMATRAFQSHVRAYATHVAGERKWFDVKKLHLGHTAKAFGIREAPGSMNVKGMRGKKGGKGAAASRGEEKEGRGVAKSGDALGAEPGKKRQRDEDDDEGMGQADVDEAKRKMRAKMKMMMAGASEFNLG